MLVRFKLTEGALVENYMMFQFYVSAIQTDDRYAWTHDRIKFQFYVSAIQT